MKSTLFLSFFLKQFYAKDQRYFLTFLVQDTRASHGLTYQGHTRYVYSTQKSFALAMLLRFSSDPMVQCRVPSSKFRSIQNSIHFAEHFGINSMAVRATTRKLVGCFNTVVLPLVKHCRCRHCCSLVWTLCYSKTIPMIQHTTNIHSMTVMLPPN